MILGLGRSFSRALGKYMTITYLDPQALWVVISGEVRMPALAYNYRYPTCSPTYKLSRAPANPYTVDLKSIRRTKT